jgi:hypothetical protein
MVCSDRVSLAFLLNVQSIRDKTFFDQPLITETKNMYSSRTSEMRLTRTLDLFHFLARSSYACFITSFSEPNKLLPSAECFLLVERRPHQMKPGIVLLHLSLLKLSRFSSK